MTLNNQFQWGPKEEYQSHICYMHGTPLSLAKLFLFFVDLQQQSRNVTPNLLDTSRMRGSIDCCPSKVDIGRGRNV
jgi:hypothetical protein